MKARYQSARNWLRVTVTDFKTPLSKEVRSTSEIVNSRPRAWDMPSYDRTGITRLGRNDRFRDGLSRRLINSRGSIRSARSGSFLIASHETGGGWLWGTALLGWPQARRAGTPACSAYHFKSLPTCRTRESAWVDPQTTIWSRLNEIPLYYLQLKIAHKYSTDICRIDIAATLEHCMLQYNVTEILQRFLLQCYFSNVSKIL